MNQKHQWKALSLGVCYYPEHWDKSLWRDDLRRMKASGLGTVRVAEFWNVRGCPLGAAISKRLKQNHTWPGHKFRCVYDEEVLPNRGGAGVSETELFCKAQINGSLVHITAIFGMTLSGLVIQDVYQKVTA